VAADVVFDARCTSRHDTPNVGNHSLPLPLDISTDTTLSGMENDPAIAAAVAQPSMPDLPVYLISGCPNPCATGEPESFYTTDPGQGTGHRRLQRLQPQQGAGAARARRPRPYPHNGAGADLPEVVNSMISASTCT